LSFTPNFNLDSDRLKKVDFKTWWNRSVVYRAGSAPEGSPPGFIPMDQSLRIPHEKRLKFSRREFVHLIRNKLGAHADVNRPEILDKLQSSELYGVSFKIQSPSGIYSTDDGTIIVKIGPAAASIRQISHEIVQVLNQIN
jgi:hypothetical protein